MDHAGIETPVTLLFIILILAHVLALSLVGGAVLARYLLPVLPLLVLLWVSVIWRCARLWMLGIALVCVAFVWRCEVNPPVTFTWEENLAYRDFILLHLDAARFIARHEPRARVLTAWPATNELTTPLLGYVNWPVRVFPVEDFKRATLEKAVLHRSSYDAALIYSTQAGLKFADLKQLLGGRVIYSEERKGQWIAVLAEDRDTSAPCRSAINVPPKKIASHVCAVVKGVVFYRMDSHSSPALGNTETITFGARLLLVYRSGFSAITRRRERHQRLHGRRDAQSHL